MIIVSKEQMQELDQTIDERLLWEYISAQNEMKVAMLSIYGQMPLRKVNVNRVLKPSA